MARVLDSFQLPIKKNGTTAAETYINNPKAIAGQFSASTAYAAGDYVFYNKVLYRFTAAHAAGAWIGTDAVAATIGADVTNLKESLSGINDNAISYGDLTMLTLARTYISPSNFTIMGNNSRNSVYVHINDTKIVCIRKMLSARFVIGYTVNEPAINEPIIGYSSHNNETELYVSPPATANYLVVYCYDETVDTATWTEIRNSISISKINGAKDNVARASLDTVYSVITDVPADYKCIEYLESNRTQYIYAGLKMNNNSRVIMDAECPNEGVASQVEYIFGARKNTAENAFGLGRSGSGKLYAGYGKYMNIAFTLGNDRHLYDFNKNNLYIDGKLVYTWPVAEFETPNSATLFATSGSASSIYYGAVRIYSCKIYDNDILVRDFVPVHRLSDDVCGMYDKVNHTFYTNAGSGTFVEGTKANILDSIENVQKQVTDVRSNISDIQESISGKDYVLTEAHRVSQKVHDVQTGDTITFVACSDLHYAVAVGTSDGVTVTESQEALKDMRDGIKAIASQTHIDFYACFGDVVYQWQNHGADYDNGITEMFAVTKILGDAFANNPQIRMVGNHDPNCENSQNKEFSAYMMNSFAGIYSEMLTKDESFPYGGYGYHDFERQKVRLIVLNTSFYTPDTDLSQGATVYNLGSDQAYWLCTVLDMSGKEDADEWQIVICSHVAMDISTQPAICRFTAVLNAYLNGSTWTHSSLSYNFSGKNAAKLALYLNGHTHAYRFKNLRYLDASGILQNILPMANLYIPNALPGRESVSTDDVTYTKTSNTAESTSFQIITVDFRNKVVYANHYGSGIDIILHYDPSTESTLTTELTAPSWASVDDAISTVENGIVTPVASGYVMIYAKSESDNCIEAWNYQSVT